MKITAEMLDRFGIKLKDKIDSIEFIDFLRKYYEEFYDLGVAKQSGKYPRDIFHYIRQYYRLSKEELKLYNTFFKINDCENYWNCHTIKRSQNLLNSNRVEDSAFIRDSVGIHFSKEVFNSVEVHDSDNVAHSRSITRSNRIFESQNITDSNDVGRSNNITWSSIILNSSNLDECSYVYMSNDLVDCHFCGFMRNSRRCLFCVGLEDKEYYIFNQQVSPIEYERIKEKLISLLEEEESTMIRINESKHTAEERFKLNRRFDSVFNGLSSSFYGWVGTLPNYSDDIFVDLFFRDREEKV